MIYDLSLKTQVKSHLFITIQIRQTQLTIQMVCLLYSTSNTTTSTLTFSIFLLITSSLSIAYVDGRPLTPEHTKEERMVGMALIGSRPPRCEGRCISCGHCEAVQVPIAPQNKLRRIFHGDEILSRGDESSTNYKPLNWKCKCGDVIINP